MHASTLVRTPRLTDLQVSMKELNAAFEKAGKRLGRRDREMVVDFVAVLIERLDRGALSS